jgi:hypothetical protein
MKQRLMFVMLLFGVVASAQAITIADPGFESFDVDPGGFTKENGAWSFDNDAGVVQPYAPNSSTAILNTWSATFDAIEGEQYASTYAGGDRIFQSVTFEKSGEYLFEVFAAAPGGSVNTGGGYIPLSWGSFYFQVGLQSAGYFVLYPDTDWAKYSATAYVEAGTHLVQIKNGASAPYFINYDAFSLTLVPLPASIWLLGSALAGLGWLRRKQTC